MSCSKSLSWLVWSCVGERLLHSKNGVWMVRLGFTTIMLWITFSCDLIWDMPLIPCFTNTHCSTCLSASEWKEVCFHSFLCADDLLHLISSVELAVLWRRMMLKDPPIWKGWTAAALRRLPSLLPAWNLIPWGWRNKQGCKEVISSRLSCMHSVK